VGAKQDLGEPQPHGARALGVRALALVAQRAFTSTWRARVLDGPERDQEVALVVLRDGATAPVRERFARIAEELRAAGEGLLGVLRVRSVARSRDAYLAHLWTAGTTEDLSALRWPLRRRLEFVCRIAESLGQLHALGLVHGCLCPENILLDDDLHPVLSDVGVASPVALREVPSYAGFAAPEVVAGEAPNVGSDIFSVGRLLQVVAMGEVSPEIAEVIRACLAPLESRYRSAADLARALAGVAETLPEEDAGSGVALASSARGGDSPARAADVRRPQPPPARPREAQLPTAVAAPRPDAIPESVLARRAPFVGIAGLLTMALALGGGFFLGGSDSSLRTAFDLFLMLGSAAAVWLLPGLPRRPAAARVALAGSCVALVAVVDPLAAVYGAAARHRLHGGRSEPRAAIDEIVRLGRDFRGVPLAGLNLSGIDLTGADLRGVDLSAADLSNARLWGAEIEGASFDGARLEGADLDHTSLAQAKVGAAKCDAATQLPAGWRCAGFHITR
jgi:hypothetical protein